MKNASKQTCHCTIGRGDEDVVAKAEVNVVGSYSSIVACDPAASESQNTLCVFTFCRVAYCNWNDGSETKVMASFMSGCRNSDITVGEMIPDDWRDGCLEICAGF